MTTKEFSFSLSFPSLPFNEKSINAVLQFKAGLKHECDLKIKLMQGSIKF